MYSLRRRLLVIATLLLLLFLGTMGVALNRAFERSVLSNAEDNLRNQILLLIANIEVVDGKVEVPDALPEPRLGQMDSSLFAQVAVRGQGVVWRSPSLLDRQLPILPNGLGEFSFHPEFEWPRQAPSYATSLGVAWETEQGDFPFVVQVAEYSAFYTKRLSRYQRQVGLWLLVFGGALIALLLALLSWALKPLRRVTQQVGEIEEGYRQRFDENYPIEVSRLTQNLNQLLNFDEQRITRQKEVLGNLAHSLKTPIAVLNGLHYSAEIDDEAKRQIATMQTIIDYQLQSASTVGRRRFAKPIEIKAQTEQIVNTLQKLHAEKNITCQLSMRSDTVFYGDQGDWMELCGNLLDNAFKWTKSQVRIAVENSQLADKESHRQALTLIVEDDGLGIDDNLKETISTRGVRLDSQAPGHGLGLHIVKGIVEAYNGDFMIEDADFDVGNPQGNDSSPRTGTRFKINLN
ncbi:MAG: two-component system sensor histidine kinase PhoQ [Arenicella sp.]